MDIPHSEALAADEALSARSATGPRVSVADLNENIVALHYINAAQAVDFLSDGSKSPAEDSPLRLLTVCFVVCRNGFVEVGKSAPASPENFDEMKGRKFAYEDAMRQLWPKMGYALCQKRYDEEVCEA